MLTGEVGLTGLEGVPPKPDPPLDPKPDPLPDPNPVLDPDPDPLAPFTPVPLVAPLRFVAAPAVASSAFWVGSNTNSHWL